MLTSPLLVGQRRELVRPLSGAEYARLAVRLRELEHQPADLLTDRASEVLRGCAEVVDTARAQQLLDRGFSLSQAVERWRSRSIWVMSRADAGYPKRLKVHLNGAAPPVLYGCGDTRLLEGGGLAVVGSRDVGEELISYAEEIGGLAARGQQLVVSGGAKGVDQAAVRGSLEGGGRSLAVLADGLEQAVLRREYRGGLMEKRLLLVSPYDPSAAFNAGNAMQRNKLIYALAEAALVVNSDVNKGGTWAGAVEQLEKLHYVRVYVRSTGELGRGIEALQRRGACPWPNPRGQEELSAALRAAPLQQQVAQAKLAL